MSRIFDAWNRFWFEPARPADLGVSRLLFFGGLTIFYGHHQFSSWADVSPALWQPIWLFDRLHLPVLPASGIRIVEAAWVASLALSAAGLFSHLSLFVAALFGTYLLGLPHNFGQTYHFDAVLVLAFWILAFSRAGDAWSIDALLKTAKRPGGRPPAPSAEYRWPIQLVCVALSFVFFAAGLAKLWRSGFEWVTSDHMAILLRRVQYHISDADPLVDWGAALAEIPRVPQVLALLTIVVETAYPVALFSRRLRLPLVLAGMGLIVGIRFLMGPTFEHFLLVNVFWVPWTVVAAWCRARVPSPPRLSVVYDGSCGLCVPTVAVLRRLDLLGRLQFFDAVSEWDHVAARFPSLSQDACLAEMHGITSDRRVVTGFDTYRAIAWLIPMGWAIAPLLHVGPIAAVGRTVYRTVAAGRSRGGCALPAGVAAGNPLTAAGCATPRQSSTHLATPAS